MTVAIHNSVAVRKTTAAQFLRLAGDIAINLRVTEKILAEIERRLFSPDQALFDIEIVKKNLQKVKALPPETLTDEFIQIQFAIDQEFNLWRGLLEQRDAKIETYHLRRFFDTSNQTFDPAVYVALAYFYRGSENRLEHLSKFDLVLTRLFSLRDRSRREARNDRDERTAELSELFARWDGTESDPPHSSNAVFGAVARFEEFLLEAEMLVDFEDLIRSNIFDRLRAFKRDLGAVFYEPAVAAVSVECNLLLGNVFNDLLTRANQNLGEKLSASFDFAGAFHDTSPNVQIRVSEILTQLREETELHDSSSVREDASHIWDLLNVVCGHTGADTESSSSATAFPSQEPKSATERLAHLLATLDEPEPDVRMLREYTQKSKTLWTIDLNDFIKNEDPDIDRICRDVLRVILLTDELCTHELNQPKDISQTVFEELSRVFQKSLDLGEILEELLEHSEGTTQNRLLFVSNKFFETRLKLERTIVRFSNHHLGLVRAPDAAHTSKTARLTTAAAPATAKPGRVNRWLMLLTLVVCVLCAAAWFFADQMAANVPKSEDVEELNAAELPSGEHFVSAFRHKGTLFVVARDSWENLQEDQKKEALGKLTGIGSPTKIETVIVTNADGRPMGDLSTHGVNVSPEL